MPDSFLDLATRRSLGFPVLPLITIAVMVIVGAVLGRARMGRELYAIGSNPDAAVLAGIRVSRRVLGAFIASRRDRRPGRRALRLPLRHAGRRRRHRHRARRGLRGGGRRRRDLRRLRHGLRRRARRAAAGHDPLVAGDPAGQPVLGAGHQRRAAAARHRPRRLPGASEWRANCARGARTVSDVKASVDDDSERSLRSRLARWETVTVFLLLVRDPLRRVDVGGLPHRRQPQLDPLRHRRDRDHRAAADADHHRRRDRPLGRLGARPHRAP